MEQINVTTQNSSYPIVISDDFKSFTKYVNRENKKCVIITDKNVEKYHIDTFCKYIENIFREIFFYVITPGEESKSLKAAEDIYIFLLEHHINRKDVIITLGGGVVGDLGGFVAATFLRGIEFVQVPTSLIAQIDSSVGGKTAVNLKNKKNIIGSFYQPKLVYINYSLLKTLPIKELKNGLVEILVHAIIKDELLFNYIETNLEQIMRLDPVVLEKIIYWNCRIKSEVVQKDETDVGERAVLNFGHTFGHAIEGYYEYRYKHGECVALGVIGACLIAERNGLITHDVTNRIENLLERIEIIQCIDDCDSTAVLNFMLYDKKVIEEKLFFILPLKIGKVERFPIEDMNLLKEVLNEIKKYSILS